MFTGCSFTTAAVGGCRSAATQFGVDSSAARYSAHKAFKRAAFRHCACPPRERHPVGLYACKLWLPLVDEGGYAFLSIPAEEEFL